MRGLATTIALCAALSPAWAQETELSAEDVQFDAATDAVRNHEYREAVDLFLPLAEQEISDAQFNLAVLFKRGRGRPQNFPEAYYWAALSILNDGTFAQDLVDEMRDILPEEDQTGVVERLMARVQGQIDAGDTEAPRKLARIYANLMIEPDYQSAYVWYAICYALGDDRCAEGRDDAAGELEVPDLMAIQAKTAETFAASAFATPPKGAEGQ